MSDQASLTPDQIWRILNYVGQVKSSDEQIRTDLGARDGWLDVYDAAWKKGYFKRQVNENIISLSALGKQWLVVSYNGWHWST